MLANVVLVVVVQVPVGVASDTQVGPEVNAPAGAVWESVTLTPAKLAPVVFFTVKV